MKWHENYLTKSIFYFQLPSGLETIKKIKIKNTAFSQPDQKHNDTQVAPSSSDTQ